MQLQFLPSLIAFISSLAVFLLRTRISTAKYVAITACVVMFAVDVIVNWSSLGSISTMLLAILVAVACMVCQAINKHAPVSMATILLVIGLFFFLVNGGPVIAKLAHACLLLVLALLSVCFRKNVSLGFGSAIAVSISIVSLLLSSLIHGSSSVIFQIIAAATLLPLFPFQVAYIGLLNNLQGTLSAFLSFILPLAGLHALVQAPNLPPVVAQLIYVSAVIGLIITGLRAFVQAGLMRVIGAVATLLLAPTWWICASNGKLAMENCSYIVAVGLVISGLSLCVHCVESRYGTQAIESLPGLAKTMPKFGIAFSLLTMAGLGIPTFAVFSSFILPQFSPMKSGVTDLLFVSAAWLICFALQISILQRLLFNQPRSNLAYTDLNRIETLSMAIILALLVIGGLFPGAMLALTI